MKEERFTKGEAARMEEALVEVMKAFPKSKAPQFFGHFNELALFIGAVKRAAPDGPAVDG